MSQAQARQIFSPQGDILQVRNQGLFPFVHSGPGRLLHALPGANVTIRPHIVTELRVASARPSYINAILIQSRGRPSTTVCTGCENLNTDHSSKAFPECRRATGHFGGACGNCKWQDHAARCSVRDSEIGGDSQSPPGDGSDDESESTWEGFGDDTPVADGSGSGLAIGTSRTVVAVVV